MLGTCIASVAVTYITSTMPVGGSGCGREYDGIGGLANSCAPWLRSYPEAARTEILDTLFKPGHVAAVQVLKLEIGGDAHSTINTESSHMHTADPDAASFDRGWEVWLAVEAKRRNPAIRIGGLAWGWPDWTSGSIDKKTNYLVDWVAGMASKKNITVDFIGLQNEGSITGGAPAFATSKHPTVPIKKSASSRRWTCRFVLSLLFLPSI